MNKFINQRIKFIYSGLYFKEALQVKYDFLKGKNNFQCGVDISRNLEKNQIDLNLLFLNMPKARIRNRLI